MPFSATPLGKHSYQSNETNTLAQLAFPSSELAHQHLHHVARAPQSASGSSGSTDECCTFTGYNFSAAAFPIFNSSGDWRETFVNSSFMVGEHGDPGISMHLQSLTRDQSPLLMDLPSGTNPELTVSCPDPLQPCDGLLTSRTQSSGLTS